MPKGTNSSLKSRLFEAYASCITPISIQQLTATEEVILHKGLRISRKTHRNGVVDVTIEDTSVGETYSRIENPFIINALIKASDEIRQQQVATSTAHQPVMAR